MPRDASPPELSSLERTALWVQAQTAFAQPSAETSPLSPSRSSKTTDSSYRTTMSSDGVSLKPSLARSSSMQQSTHTRPPSAKNNQRPRYDSRTRRSSLPFPQSPPGSGYPIPLEVAAPHPPESEVRKSPTPRPSLRKQRRPSLIEQIISIGSPGQRRREEPVSKKA
ncbi:hypothetical protein L226DRAFT_528454 [Lentinus tigrinus ALCF2SS1-7]|uniref:uncharacterized protein n=1 Tax=Lentinus tigrinus ALCF2SS1-7 TaxID=1328758 RepID=UPI001165D2BA|nr:hypothetical protein L226DRAFT_528454 [Lentinus tigrinus ALCF2SS1-7]